MAETETEAAPEPRRNNPVKTVFETVLNGGSGVLTLLAIVAALIVGAILIILSNQDVLDSFGYFFAAPGDSFHAMWTAVSEAYSALFRGSIVDPGTIGDYANGQASLSDVFYPICQTVTQATPLILAGLSVTVAFRAGLFNIGAQGQIVVGAILSAYLGFAIDLPVVLHVLVALAGGFAAGALWGFIVGWLKAATGTHEVITTIMMNYISSALLLYMLERSAFRRPGRTDLVSPIVHHNGRLPYLAGSYLQMNAGIIVALAAAVGCAWLLRRSTIGFEFKTVGSNADAARTAGMSPKRVYILAMLIAGGLAGLASTSQVLGTDGYLSQGVDSNLGFNAITVALLGRASPGGTVLAGFLFGALQAGGVIMQADASTSPDVITVIQSLIVLFIAAPPLVRAMFRLRGARRGTADQTLSKGWNG
ncbi:MAG TPA: ABC transporter permease [Mycobacteriales bacterium]|nr:ABC transporter permease [Mycobacteriales bacterium]